MFAQNKRLGFAAAAVAICLGFYFPNRQNVEAKPSNPAVSSLSVANAAACIADFEQGKNIVTIPGSSGEAQINGVMCKVETAKHIYDRFEDSEVAAYMTGNGAALTSRPDLLGQPDTVMGIAVSGPTNLPVSVEVDLVKVGKQTLITDVTGLALSQDGKKLYEFSVNPAGQIVGNFEGRYSPTGYEVMKAGYVDVGNLAAGYADKPVLVSNLPSADQKYIKFIAATAAKLAKMPAPGG